LGGAHPLGRRYLHVGGEGRKQFFFEKKNQKTFVDMAYAAGENPDHDIKVFCFFSSEKKTFFSSIGTIG
jgi:hypothetical protein